MHTRRMAGRKVAWLPRLLLVLAVPALFACDAMKPPVEGPRREYVRVPPPPLDSLRASPETIDVGDLRIVAGAELWLNLMPGPSADESLESSGTPLLGTIRIHPADTTAARPLPAGFALQGAWLRLGDSIWAFGVVPTDTTRATDTSLALSVWGGPAWLGRESEADVVLRVRRPDRASRLLRVRGVRVEVSE